MTDTIQKIVAKAPQAISCTTMRARRRSGQVLTERAFVWPCFSILFRLLERHRTGQKAGYYHSA